MMKHEFETLLGCEVSPEEYKKIESVYMWLDDFTKEDIAKLFRFNEQFVLKTLYSKYLADERIRQRNTLLEGSDALVQELKTRNSVLNTDNDNLIAENRNLLNANKELDKLLTRVYAKTSKTNGDLRYELFKAYEAIKDKDIRIDELETELQQYRTIFGSIAEMVRNI